MKNTPKKFTAGERVATPVGYCYVVSDVGDGYVVSTKRATGRGVNHEFPYKHVKPYLVRPFQPGNVVKSPAGRGFIIDVLYPRQPLAMSLYQLTRKQTGLPKPFKALGDYTSCRTYSYLVWEPEHPVFVMWYGEWELGDVVTKPLDTFSGCSFNGMFSKFFELVDREFIFGAGDPPNQTTPTTTEPEPDEEDDEPDNLNDLNVPGLSEGRPVL